MLENATKIENAINLMKGFISFGGRGNAKSEQSNLFRGSAHTLILAARYRIPERIRVERAGCEEFDYNCPNCGNRSITKVAGEWVAGSRNLYCPACGQALDWGGTL